MYGFNIVFVSNMRTGCFQNALLCVQWAGKDDYIGEGTPAIPLGIAQVSREGGDRQTGRYDQNMIRRKVVFPT